ncbi:hypothetical protein CS542_07965 [Pedobacter sp. IW39]|nr:hypothetical protein CS542_07965 [Pedobacter sp. IW39]
MSLRKLLGSGQANRYDFWLRCIAETANTVTINVKGADLYPYWTGVETNPLRMLSMENSDIS